MQDNTPQPTINDFSDTVKPEFSETTIKPWPKTSIQAYSKVLFNKEVTISDLRDADKAGTIWEARHTLFINEYIIQSVPSNPPLQLFEIYELWEPFLDFGIEKKYYPSVKHVAKCFIKFLRGQLRNAETSDFKNVWTIVLELHYASSEKYNLALRLYSEKQNQDKSTL